MCKQNEYDRQKVVMDRKKNDKNEGLHKCSS